MTTDDESGIYRHDESRCIKVEERVDTSDNEGRIIALSSPTTRRGPAAPVAGLAQLPWRCARPIPLRCLFPLLHGGHRVYRSVPAVRQRRNSGLRHDAHRDPHRPVRVAGLSWLSQIRRLSRGPVLPLDHVATGGRMWIIWMYLLQRRQLDRGQQRRVDGCESVRRSRPLTGRRMPILWLYQGPASM
jgi:hypothetical protein